MHVPYMCTGNTCIPLHNTCTHIYTLCTCTYVKHYLLYYRWVLYYYKADKKIEWNECIKKIIDFDSVS